MSSFRKQKKRGNIICYYLLLSIWTTSIAHNQFGYWIAVYHDKGCFIIIARRKRKQNIEFTSLNSCNTCFYIIFMFSTSPLEPKLLNWTLMLHGGNYFRIAAPVDHQLCHSKLDYTHVAPECLQNLTILMNWPVGYGFNPLSLLAFVKNHFQVFICWRMQKH